jgi:hypothetical protein
MSFWKTIAADTKLRIRNVISNEASCYGSRSALHIKGKKLKPKVAQKVAQIRLLGYYLHIKEAMNTRKILAVKNATEHRDLGTLSYNNKFKCEIQAKKASMRVEGDR